MYLKKLSPVEMITRIERLIEQQPEVEALSYIMGKEKMLEWMHSIGVLNDPILSKLAPSIPPLELRRIVAAPSAEVFLWTGLIDSLTCIEICDKYLNPELDSRINILDFGCGCGRTTRFLQNLSEFEITGTDVNKMLVKWCQNNLKNVKTFHNDLFPPLAINESSLDFIYTLSIFTHLSETSLLNWFAELSRIIKVNGIILVTTHGYQAIEIILNSEHHRKMFSMSAHEVDELHKSLKVKGFVFKKYTSETLNSANAGDDYGNSFINESYMRDICNGGEFEIVEYRPGGLRGWQDIFILRRL